MRIVMGQCIRVWPGEVQRGQRVFATVFCWMSKSPAVLALTCGKNIRFNLIFLPHDSAKTAGDLDIQQNTKYTLSGRSCPLNTILAIFTGCLRWPRLLMVKQDT